MCLHSLLYMLIRTQYFADYKDIVTFWLWKKSVQTNLLKQIIYAQ